MVYQVKSTPNQCSRGFPFGSPARRPLSLLMVIGGLLVPPLHGAEALADNAATEQRETTANWLRLESDRKTYKEAHPTTTPQQSLRQDMRLQQQGLRDRQDLARERQASGVARQQQRLERNTPGAPRPSRGTPHSRFGEQLRLQNRLQRNGWPRH